MQGLSLADDFSSRDIPNPALQRHYEVGCLCVCGRGGGVGAVRRAGVELPWYVWQCWAS